jgi:hypothetical protein
MGIFEKLVTRLKPIDATYDQLSAAGAHPVLVIGFRGKASRYFVFASLTKSSPVNR